MSKSKIIRGSLTIMFFAVFSKILGLLRETFTAYNFGAKYDIDVYLLSMETAIVVLTCIGTAVNTTFIPMFSEYSENKSSKERDRFVNNVITVVMLAVLLITVICIVFTRQIVYLFAFGFRNNSEVFNQTVGITRMMFLALLFIGVQNTISGVLQSHNEFTVPALKTIVLNLTLVLYLVFFAGKYSIYGYAVSTVAAHYLQFGFHVYKFKRLGYKYKFTLDFKDEGLRKMIVLMMPVILGASLGEINYLIDKIFGTMVGEGAVSVLNYADKVNMFVYGIFVVGISTVIYPSLSKYNAQNDEAGYKRILERSINIILLIMVPATIGMVILREPVINILFNRGAFDRNAVNNTTTALLFYAPTMITYGIRDIVSKGFYSLKDTATPMKNSILGILVNIVLNALIAPIMKTAGLSLATSISSLVTTLTLIYGLNRRLKGINLSNMARELFKIICSSIIMGLGVYFTNLICLLKYGNTFRGNLISLCISTITGILIYLLILKIFNVNEYMNVYNAAVKKLILKKTG